MNYQETLKKADISTNTSGDNTIIAAPTEEGAYIAIDFISLIPTAPVTVQLKDGSTAYGGAYPLAANQAFVFENAIHNEHGVITLSPKTAFILNLGSGVQVGGFVRYRILGSNNL